MIRISTQLFSVFHQAGRSTALWITTLLLRFRSDTRLFLYMQSLYPYLGKEVYPFDHILQRSTQCHMHDCLCENHPYSSRSVLWTHCSGECTPLTPVLSDGCIICLHFIVLEFKVGMDGYKSERVREWVEVCGSLAWGRLPLGLPLPENKSEVILVKVNTLQSFSMVSALQDTSPISVNRYTPLIFNHWAAIASQPLFSQYGLAL